jgi:hypothetical protein
MKLTLATLLLPLAMTFLLYTGAEIVSQKLNPRESKEPHKVHHAPVLAPTFENSEEHRIIGGNVMEPGEFPFAVGSEDNVSFDEGQKRNLLMPLKTQNIKKGSDDTDRHLAQEGSIRGGKTEQQERSLQSSNISPLLGGLVAFMVVAAVILVRVLVVYGCLACFSCCCSE